MGLLRRLFTRPSQVEPTASTATSSATSGTGLGIAIALSAPLRTWSDQWARFAQPVLLSGSHVLEIVGESNYQNVLWRAVGGQTLERVRIGIQAVLATEPDNPYDSNAISIWIAGEKAGYLSREDAENYRTGLLMLQQRELRDIALSGVVTGGGVRADGPGRLGVWLYHDPRDFGVDAIVPPMAPVLRATMRTGLTEALLTDAEDDSYDLSWLQRLPSDHIAAIGRLRALLTKVPDPIDRHFMYCELEERLYRSRDAFTSALDDYDEACHLHDAEMDGMRDALFAKFGKVPLLDTYRQMAVRHQKAKNWAQALHWSRRGLALYGDHAARLDAVDDLNKRVTGYSAKLDDDGGARRSVVRGKAAVASTEVMETLECRSCAAQYIRPLTRGRKPKCCPECRDLQ